MLAAQLAGQARLLLHVFAAALGGWEGIMSNQRNFDCWESDFLNAEKWRGRRVASIAASIAASISNQPHISWSGA